MDMSVSGRLAHRLQAWGSIDEGVVETLFHDLPDAVIYASCDRQVLGANPAAFRIFGYDHESFLGLATRELYANPEDYRRQGETSFNPRRLSGRTRAVIQYLRRDGSLFWGETTAAAVCNSDGEILGYLSITRDITEKLATERALKRLYIISSDQSRDGERKIADIMELGRSFFDMETAVIGEVQGDEYVVRKTVPCESMHPIPGERFPVEETQCSRTLKAGAPFAFSERADGLGSDMVGSYIGAPIRVEGEVYGTLAFFRSGPHAPFRSQDMDFARIFAEWVGYEIAARQARERLLLSREEALHLRAEAEKASRAKSRFLASIARDLRDPMSAIGAAIDALAISGLDAEQKTCLRRLEAARSAMGRRLFEIERLTHAQETNMDMDQDMDGETLDVSLVAEIFETLGTAGLPVMLEKLGHGFRCGLAALEAAIAAGSAEDCRRAAHSLKGQALNFGAIRLAALADSIESDARSGRIDPGWAEPVSQACDNTLMALTHRAALASTTA
ncbi:MAG: hypothetical protein Kow00104_13850 [Rhodothalassiaceae bacterium]